MEQLSRVPLCGSRDGRHLSRARYHWRSRTFRGVWPSGKVRWLRARHADEAWRCRSAPTRGGIAWARAPSFVEVRAVRSSRSRNPGPSRCRTYHEADPAMHRDRSGDHFSHDSWTQGTPNCTSPAICGRRARRSACTARRIGRGTSAPTVYLGRRSAGSRCCP